MATRQGRAVEQTAASRAFLSQRGAAPTEQIAVPQLVDRVLKVEPPEEGIRRVLSGAKNIAATVSFHLGERQQLAQASIDVAPHPAMHRSQRAVNRRTPAGRHNRDPASIVRSSDYDAGRSVVFVPARSGLPLMKTIQKSVTFRRRE